MKLWKGGALRRLTLGVPTRVRIAQRQAEAPCFAAWPCLERIVAAWDEIPLRHCVFRIEARPVRNVWIVGRHGSRVVLFLSM